MLNSKLYYISEDEGFELSEYEELESNENGIITLKHEPVKDLFVYDKETG
jgi:hypothetical protein